MPQPVATIVELPDPCERVTVFPLSGLPLASTRLTVTMDALLPLAGTVARVADTVEADAETGPTTRL